MKLYEIVQKGIFTNDKVLKQFSFTLSDNNTDDFYIIKKPTLKDFVQLCDKEVSYIDLIETDDNICSTKINIIISVNFEKDNGYYSLNERRYNA